MKSPDGVLRLSDGRELGTGPAYTGSSYLQRFCHPCDIATADKECFVCGLPTIVGQPHGWYETSAQRSSYGELEGDLDVTGYAQGTDFGLEAYA